MQDEPSYFRAWRLRLGLTTIEAADMLGRSRRQIQYYDAGKWEVPIAVRLAMDHLEEHPEKLRELRIAANTRRSQHPTSAR